MTISEKVAYLKGLAEGLGLDREESKETKLIAEIISTLEEVAFSIEDIEENELALGEEIDVLSDDLAIVEELLFGDDDDDDDDDDEDCYSVKCPACGDEIMVDESILLEGSIECPGCGEKLEFEFDEDDCDCGHCH